MMPRAVEESNTLRNIAKFGGPDDCCGVWAIQAGVTKQLKKIDFHSADRAGGNAKFTAVAFFGVE
jgi:hypothetical protein